MAYNLFYFCVCKPQLLWYNVLRSTSDRYFKYSSGEFYLMLKYIKKDIICPSCTEKVEAELLRGVNVSENPEYREKIMDESIFEWQCPNCSHKSTISYPFLYHDEQKKFMVYLIPESCNIDLKAKVLSQEFPELLDIKKRVVSFANSLKEKILIFESSLDDVAIELTKLALSRVIKEKNSVSLLSGYFHVLDDKNNKIDFVFFKDETSEVSHYNTRIDVYRKSLSISEEFFDDSSSCFIRVDRTLADKVLNLYKSS